MNLIFGGLKEKAAQWVYFPVSPSKHHHIIIICVFIPVYFWGPWKSMMRGSGVISFLVQSFSNTSCYLRYVAFSFFIILATFYMISFIGYISLVYFSSFSQFWQQCTSSHLSLISLFSTILATLILIISFLSAVFSLSSILASPRHLVPSHSVWVTRWDQPPHCDPVAQGPKPPQVWVAWGRLGGGAGEAERIPGVPQGSCPEAPALQPAHALWDCGPGRL